MAKIKMDPRSIIAARVRAKKEAARLKSKDLTFVQCHLNYFGTPYVWVKGEHPCSSDDKELRALYHGFRFGKGENQHDKFVAEYQEIVDRFSKEIKEFTDKVNATLGEK